MPPEAFSIIGNLNEARRNPEQNISESTLAQLQQYEGDPDIFVTFTAGMPVKYKPSDEAELSSRVAPKIGINPKSTYKTPLGIYCYPVDEVIDYSIDRKEISARYTGSSEWEFIYVLRRKTRIGVVETDEDAVPYFEKLKKYAAKLEGGDALVRAGTEDSLEQSERGYLWNVSRIIAADSSSKPSAAWNGLMRKLGVTQFVDRHEQGLIHSNEPTQAVFFDPTSYNVVAMISRKRETYIRFMGSKIARMIRDGQLTARNFDPICVSKLIKDNYKDELKIIYDSASTLLRQTIDKILSKLPIDNLNGLYNRLFINPKLMLSAKDISRLYNAARDIVGETSPLVILQDILERPFNRDELFNYISCSLSAEGIGEYHYSFLDKDFIIELLQKIPFIPKDTLQILANAGGIDLEQILDRIFHSNADFAVHLGYKPSVEDWVAMLTMKVTQHRYAILFPLIPAQPVLKKLMESEYFANSILLDYLNYIAKKEPMLALRALGGIANTKYIYYVMHSRYELANAITEYYTYFFLINPVIAMHFKPMRWTATRAEVIKVLTLPPEEASPILGIIVKNLSKEIVIEFMDNSLFFLALLNNVRLIREIPAKKYAETLYKNSNLLPISDIAEYLVTADQVIQYIKLDPSIISTIHYISNMELNDLIRLLKTVPEICDRNKQFLENIQIVMLARLWLAGAIHISQVSESRRPSLVAEILHQSPSSFMVLWYDTYAAPAFNHILLPTACINMFRNTPEMKQYLLNKP